MLRRVISDRAHPALVIATALLFGVVAAIAHVYRSPLMFDLLWIIAMGDAMLRTWKESRWLALLAISRVEPGGPAD